MGFPQNSPPCPTAPVDTRWSRDARRPLVSPQVTEWLRTIAVTSAAMLVASCDEGVLDPHGPVGKAERVILYDSTAIMLAVVIPVIVLTLVFAWWFRARNSRARYRPDWEYSGRIEMIIWSIPALVILFLGGIAWTGSHDLDPPAPLARIRDAARYRSHLPRLALAFHLSERGNRKLEPFGRAGGSAAPISPDLDDGHEQLLRAAVGQSDLHDAEHGHPAQFAGRSNRHLRRPLGAVQRRRLLRHAL